MRREPYHPECWKEKGHCSTKSLYLPDELTEQIMLLSHKYGSSFSSIVVSMIEYSLENMEEPKDE